MGYPGSSKLIEINNKYKYMYKGMKYEYEMISNIRYQTSIQVQFPHAFECTYWCAYVWNKFSTNRWSWTPFSSKSMSHSTQQLGETSMTAEQIEMVSRQN